MNLWMLFLLIIFVLLALLAAGYLGWKGRKFIERIESLEKIVKRRKLPYPAMAGLEDALALIDDSQFETAFSEQFSDCLIGQLLVILQHEEATRAYNDKRYGQVQDILKKIRSDPQGYDVNQASGKQKDA